MEKLPHQLQETSAVTMDPPLKSALQLSTRNQLHALHLTTHAPPLNTSTNQPIFSHLSAQVQLQYPSGTPPSIYGLPFIHALLSFDSFQLPPIYGTGINRGDNKSGFEVGKSLAQSISTDLPMYSKYLVTSLPNLSSNCIIGSLAPSMGTFPEEKLNDNYFS